MHQHLVLVQVVSLVVAWQHRMEYPLLWPMLPCQHSESKVMYLCTFSVMGNLLIKPCSSTHEYSSTCPT